MHLDVIIIILAHRVVKYRYIFIYNKTNESGNFFFKLLYYIHFYSIDSIRFDSNKSSKLLVVVFKILITIKAYRKRSKFNAGDFVVVVVVVVVDSLIHLLS